MATEEEVEQMRITEEQAKEAIALRDALVRLQHNADFKEVISNKFFKEEASRLVLLRADPSIQQDEKIVKSIDNKIIGVGELRQFFITILQRGNQLEQDLKEAREEYNNTEQGE